MKVFYNLTLHIKQEAYKNALTACHRCSGCVTRIMGNQYVNLVPRVSLLPAHPVNEVAKRHTTTFNEQGLGIENSNLTDFVAKLNLKSSRRIKIISQQKDIEENLAYFEYFLVSMYILL